MKDPRIGLAIIASVILAGCATFEVNAYRTIGTTAATVDTLMKSWADEAAAGRTTQEIDSKVRVAHASYQKSMLVTQMAIDGYRAGTNTQERVNATLSQISANKETLRQIILSLALPANVQSNLTKLP